MEVQILSGYQNAAIDIVIGEKVDELEEVTIVAFGKQKKESVIRIQTLLRPADLKVPTSNLKTALAGDVRGSHLVFTTRRGNRETPYKCIIFL